MVYIRTATEKDIDSVMKLEQIFHTKWGTVNDIEKIDKDWFMTNKHKKHLRKFIKDKKKKLFLTVDKGEITGFLKCIIERWEPFLQEMGYISEIFVLPENRGKRAGSKLFKNAVKWFKSKNIEEVTLNTHFKDKGANLFWEKMGFQEYCRELKIVLKSQRKI